MATYNTGIYAIENIVNGKLYIGSASHLYQRFSGHRQKLRAGKHANNRLQAAFNKYGEAAFRFKTLLYCRKEDLLMFEQRAIDGFRATIAGYNIEPVAGRSTGMTGRRHADETKRKMSEKAAGRTFTAEHRQALSKAKSGKKRGAHSEDHKRKLSISIRAALKEIGRFEFFDSSDYKAKQSDNMKRIWKERKGG